MHYLCYQLHSIHIHTDSFIVSDFSTNMHPVVDTKFCHRNPNNAAWFPARPCQDDCWNEKGFGRKRLCPTVLTSEVPPTCQSVLTSRHSPSRQPVHLPRFEPDSSWIHSQSCCYTAMHRHNSSNLYALCSLALLSQKRHLAFDWGLFTGYGTGRSE